jgi:integrase/recombinase XerD
MKKYEFKPSIEDQLGEFESYLKAKNLHENTISQHSNYAGIFLSWLENENLEKSEVGYNDVIAFVQHLQSKENTSRFINRVLLAARHYYYFLDLGENPVANIYLKGEQRNTATNPLEYQEILAVYEQYQPLDNRMKRNKVMLSLMVFQGLSTSELQQLELRHIHLKKATIYVPQCGKSNPRTLELKATQLLEIQEYLLVTRLQMLANLRALRSGRKPNKIEMSELENQPTQLFFSENGAREIKNSVKHLFRAIRKVNPKISSPKIIKQSLIANWISQYGIRKAQVLAGHRYVSSTERYDQKNLKELSLALAEFHPLK